VVDAVRPYQTEVNWYHHNVLAPFESMTELLADKGYDGFTAVRNESTINQRTVLRVRRWAEPTQEEWAALEALGDHPVDCAHDGRTESVASGTTHVLLISGLVTLIKYPRVRRSRWEAHHGNTPPGCLCRRAPVS
jgi:hypothetical protein